MWQEIVVAWCHYRVLCMLWLCGEWVKAGPGVLWSLGGSAGVDRSILMLISCPLKVVLLLWNVSFSLSPPPASPPAGFASLFLWESEDLTHHDQYLVSHAWNRQMFGVSFSETGSFCWVKGINASFRLWGCRPAASEGWLMRFLPALGPLRFACLPGLSCPVSPLIQTLTQTSVQSKQLSWSGRGLDVKQQGCDWELICSFANCVSESESVVPSQLSAIYNNFFLSLFSSRSLSFPVFLSISIFPSLSLVRLPQHLQQHENAVEGDACYYHCVLCNYSTKAKLNLIQHVRSMKHQRSESLRKLQRLQKGLPEEEEDLSSIFTIRKCPSSDTGQNMPLGLAFSVSLWYFFIFFFNFLDVFAYTCVSCTQLRIHMLNWEAFFYLSH